MFKLLPLVILLTACAPLNFNPTNAAISGLVEIESAAGVYTIDLKTGAVLTQCTDSIKVRKIEAVALVEDANSAQYIRISEKLNNDAKWTNCTEVTLFFSGIELTQRIGCLPAIPKGEIK